MDLGTVKRKLERNTYKNVKDCAEDIRQIWTNCKTYNADESDFYLLAENFSKKFEEKYAKIEADCKYFFPDAFLQLFHFVFPFIFNSIHLLTRISFPTTSNFELV